jgi:hypothetical protein
VCWPLRGGRGTQYTQKTLKKYIGKKKRKGRKVKEKEKMGSKREK